MSIILNFLKVYSLLWFVFNMFKSNFDLGVRSFTSIFLSIFIVSLFLWIAGAAHVAAFVELYMPYDMHTCLSIWTYHYSALRVWYLYIYKYSLFLRSELFLSTSHYFVQFQLQEFVIFPFTFPTVSICVEVFRSASIFSAHCNLSDLKNSIRSKSICKSVKCATFNICTWLDYICTRDASKSHQKIKISTDGYINEHSPGGRS